MRNELSKMRKIRVVRIQTLNKNKNIEKTKKELSFDFLCYS